MSQSSNPPFLVEAVHLLVQQFGEGKVRDALAEVTIGHSTTPARVPRESRVRGQHPGRPTIASALESVRGSDPDKYDVLSQFFSRLKDRKTLVEPQDIRHFAQRIGFKGVGGKSRKEMVPRLMRFLLEEPREKLFAELEMADGISEQQRQQGFSVLTDKLLGGK
jgi:hypothetical protein